MIQSVYNTTIKQRWQIAWGNKIFKHKLIIAFTLLVVIVCCLPFFFQYIEKRNGLILNDIILNKLAPKNVSLFIFLIIWIVTLVSIIRSVQQPHIFITLLSSFTVLTLSRILTISLIALNPPPGLIELSDPLSNFFYGNTFITKDLFFSGHTATMFLMFLCLNKKKDKLLALTATFLTGFLLLVQHVHYSIDIITAPLFTYLIYLSVKAWLRHI